MTIFYIKIGVTPAKNNSFPIQTSSATAYVWINESEVESALLKARYYVEKACWEIESLESVDIVKRDMFQGKDIGQAKYDEAVLEGIALFYVGVNEQLEAPEYVELSGGAEQDKKLFYGKKKNISNRKACLHFGANEDCDQIIKAHSIQRSQSLEAIERKGHVYQVDFDALSKTGNISYNLIGINKASTFYGFCKKHDNELFKDIDDEHLIPNYKQTMLYAYRSITKEVFTQQSAISMLKAQIESFPKPCVEVELVRNMLSEMEYGLDALHSIKAHYDESLANETYDDISYVAFYCKEAPVAAFSGLIYPDFDFQGRSLQNLDGSTNKLSLVTYCSAPMGDGWCFLFSWHKSCEQIARNYMGSVAQLMKSDRILGDALLNLVILNCENHAFSPDWWEGLEPSLKTNICEAMNKQADVLSVLNHDYLTSEINGIASWVFESIFDSSSL
jgi:hypothetical protein